MDILKKPDLTPSQRMLLLYFAQEKTVHGSFSALADELAMSRITFSAAMKVLRHRGYVKLNPASYPQEKDLGGVNITYVEND